MKELNFTHNNGLDRAFICRINQDALHHMTGDDDDNAIVSHFGQIIIQKVYRIRIIICLSVITQFKRD